MIVRLIIYLVLPLMLTSCANHGNISQQINTGMTFEETNQFSLSQDFTLRSTQRYRDYTLRKWNKNFAMPYYAIFDDKGVLVKYLGTFNLYSLSKSKKTYEYYQKYLERFTDKHKKPDDTIVVKKRKSNSKSKTTTPPALNISPPQPGSTEVNKPSSKLQYRTALVVGNGDYIGARLKNPVKDATDIASILQKLNFKVTLKTNIDQRTMETAVKNFRNDLQKNNGVGLFYFAGHGIQIDGENYLIPVESQITSETDVRYKAIPVGQILGYMDEANSALNILVLDACRNNPIERSFRSVTNGLARVKMPISDLGYIVGFATEPGSVAMDGAGTNSPFTYHLLDALKTPGLSLSEIFRQTRRGVYRDTNQAQRPLVIDGTLEDFHF